MHLLSILFFIAVVSADLGCLKWNFLFQPFGLLCWFAHDEFNAVENATVNAIETFSEDVKDAAVFQIEHHPLVLAYEWADTAIHNGTSDANHQLGESIKDELKVDLGFGKEVVNTVVSLYELTHWYDVATCLMADARDVSDSTPGIFANSTTTATAKSPTATNTTNTTNTSSNDSLYLIGSRPIRLPVSNDAPDSATSRVKRDDASGLAAAENLAKECVSDKFKQLANPAVFNITDPKEKIGSTLAQVATFFVPIGPEAGGTKIALNGFDLAIPGAEDAGRIFLKSESGAAEHFASEAEALAVKDNLKDTEWVKVNCDTCQAPGGAISRKAKRSQAHAEIQEQLLRRGASLSMCCVPPAELPEIPVDLDEPDPNGPSQEITQKSVPYHDPRLYAVIPESDLTPPPDLQTWGDAAANKEDILQDLEKDNTAVLAWSPDITKVISSKELFNMLRKAFNPVNDEDKAFAKAIGVTEFDGKNRLSANSLNFLDSKSPLPNLKKLQDFTNAAIKQIKDTVISLKDLDEVRAAGLRGDMDIYYIPASEKAINNPDPRGLHIDNNILQFGAADQPGLIVQNKPNLFRVPIVDNGWHLIKCTEWNLNGWRPKDAMAHTVFGPDIVKHGRVSIIVNVY